MRNLVIVILFSLVWSAAAKKMVNKRTLAPHASKRAHFVIAFVSYFRKNELFVLLHTILIRCSIFDLKIRDVSRISVHRLSYAFALLSRSHVLLTDTLCLLRFIDFLVIISSFSLCYYHQTLMLIIVILLNFTQKIRD